MKKNKRYVKFFVVLRSGPALLGMPDIDTLGVVTIKCEAIGRQVASDDNADRRKRNCQYERAVQTEGGKPETWINKRQDVVQKQSNADNTAEAGVVPNPTVMGNNNNKDKSFISELIINENQKLSSEQFREDDLKTNVKKNKWEKQ